MVWNYILVGCPWLVKNHESQSITNESQLKKKRVWNWKFLGLYETRQFIRRQTLYYSILKSKYSPSILIYNKGLKKYVSLNNSHNNCHRNYTNGTNAMTYHASFYASGTQDEEVKKSLRGMKKCKIKWWMTLKINQALSYLPWVWFWSWSTSKATIKIHTGQYVIYSLLQVYSIQMTLNNTDDKTEKKLPLNMKLIQIQAKSSYKPRNNDDDDDNDNGRFFMIFN